MVWEIIGPIVGVLTLGFTIVIYLQRRAEKKNDARFNAKVQEEQKRCELLDATVDTVEVIGDIMVKGCTAACEGKNNEALKRTLDNQRTKKLAHTTFLTEQAMKQVNAR